MGVREDIVSCAREHIGDAYNREASYPRTGPACDYDSFNCSGFTRAVYDECGLTIPSWQGAQNGEGSQSDWVRWAGNWTDDPSELRAGDLVFFGTSPYNTTHVGISLGGYDMIDSVPNGGVQERTLYDSFVGGGWPFEDGKDEAYIKCNGTVRFLTTMNIRERPTTNSAAFATVDAGETRNIDRVCISDGGAWCHWVGSESGKDCYVAMTRNGTDFAEAI